MCLWSINWEFGVESLGRLTTFESLFTFESYVKRGRLIRILIGHPIVEAHATFDFFSPSDSSGYSVNRAPNILFSTDSAGVGVVDKAVTLLRWMQIGRADTGIEINSLVVWLVSVFVNVVRLVQRERSFSFTPSLLHLFLIQFHVITRINDRPTNASVFW